MRNYKLLVILVLAVFFIPNLVSGQMFKADQWSLQVNGGLSQPLGELGNWFKPTYNVTGGFTRGFSDRVATEVRVNYYYLDKEGSGGGTKYPMPSTLVLNFRSVGLTCSALINLSLSSKTKPYIIAGTGLYRWNCSRGGGNYKGENILAKRRNEYSYGFNGGIGVAIAAGNKAYIDINARWEGIIGQLYPTLYLGLEKVQPIATLGLNAGIRILL